MTSRAAEGMRAEDRSVWAVDLIGVRALAQATLTNDSATARKLFSVGAAVLDVRTAEEFVEGHAHVGSYPRLTVATSPMAAPSAVVTTGFDCDAQPLSQPMNQ